MNDASQTNPGTLKAELTLKSMHESTRKKLKLFFITCHGTAMKARPLTDITFQCEMDKTKGLDLGHAGHADRESDNCKRVYSLHN